MGQGRTVKCGNCGYEFTAMYGVGFLYPYEYKETIERGRKGELGRKVREFLEEHPDGALDISLTAMQCGSCGKLDNKMKLNMYLRREDAVEDEENPGRWSVPVPAENVEYVIPWELGKKHRLHKRYQHVCSRCGGKMKYLKEGSCLQALPCPKCHSVMNEVSFLHWD